MTIHWLLAANSLSRDALETHAIASIRLRAGTLTKAVMTERVSFGDTVPADAGLVIIGKVGTDAARQAAWLAQIRTAKAQGASIVLAYTDHHLGIDGSPMAAFYAAAISMADAVITPGAFMREQVESHFTGPVFVIEDAIDVPLLPVRSSLRKARRGLWFGHPSNLPYLAEFIAAAREHLRKHMLIIVSDEVGLQEIETARWSQQTGLKIEPILWSQSAMVNAAKRADFCIIPSDRHDPRKAGASANRLITALALGLPVIAEPLPAYEPYRDYFADIHAPESRAVINGSRSAELRTQHAQTEVVPLFDASALGEKWKQLLGSFGVG